MKAITLHQPWASLIAEGIKTIETRSWAPSREIIGQRIAIHAAKRKSTEEDLYILRKIDPVVRLECQGTSHGLSVRVARGVYCRPSTFRSRPIEWEETVHADTGLLGFTTKHLYYAGTRKKFRVWYD